MYFIHYLSILGLSATLAAAQSLGELAKKEKERRASSDEAADDAKAYTNDDLDGGEEPGSKEPEPIDGTSEAATKPQNHSSLDDWRQGKEADKAAWRGRLAEYQKRFTAERERLAGLLQVREQCERDAMPIESTELVATQAAQVTWGVGHVTCEAVPRLVQETEKTMRAIETECATDARRHFIPIAEAKLH